MSEKVLFIGGTGNISLPCVAEAVSAGYERASAPMDFLTV